MPGEQGQAQERQKLRQPDEPEIEHPAGQVVNLPADRYDDHLYRERGAKPGAEISGEIALPQDREAAGDRRGAQTPALSRLTVRARSSPGDPRAADRAASGTCARSRAKAGR